MLIHLSCSSPPPSPDCFAMIHQLLIIIYQWHASGFTSPVCSVSSFSKTFFAYKIQFFCLELNVSQSLLKLFFLARASPGFSQVPGFSFGVQVPTISLFLAKIPLAPGSLHLSLRLYCALFPHRCSQLPADCPTSTPHQPVSVGVWSGRASPCIFQGARWPVYRSVTPCK